MADKSVSREDGANSPFPQSLPALTSVRFVLAAGVAFFHYHLVWPLDDMAVTHLLERARLGVDVFFILSGFILTHVYHRRASRGRYSHGRFLLARIARVYPMHLAALALFVAMVLAGQASGAGFRTTYAWSDLAAAVALVQAWSPDPNPNPWNGPSWSLSAEWFAYLLYPAFAWAGLRLRSRPTLLLLLAGALFVGLDAIYAAAYGTILPRAEEGLGILRIVPEFLYGVALYRLGERAIVSRRGSVAFASVSAVVFLSLMHFGVDDRLIVLAAGPLVLSLALLSKREADGAFSRSWMLLAGEASYALYLLHMPLLIAWRYAASMVAGRAVTSPLPVAEALVLFVMTTVAALVAHILWERPARDWIRRFADRRWPAAAPTTSVPPGSQPPDY